MRGIAFIYTTIERHRTEILFDINTSDFVFASWYFNSVTVMSDLQLENKSLTRGYSEVTVGADEVAVAASSSGTAHALVNIDTIRSTFFLGCQDSVINYNGSTSDFNVWKDL